MPKFVYPNTPFDRFSRSRVMVKRSQMTEDAGGWIDPEAERRLFDAIWARGDSLPKPQLAGRETCILEAAGNLKATDERTRKTAAEIVREAFGVNADPNSFKRVFSSLVKRHFLFSSHGGYWLTANTTRYLAVHI
jgi:hypothetical protein